MQTRREMIVSAAAGILGAIPGASVLAGMFKTKGETTTTSYTREYPEFLRENNFTKTCEITRQSPGEFTIMARVEFDRPATTEDMARGLRSVIDDMEANDVTAAASITFARAVSKWGRTTVGEPQPGRRVLMVTTRFFKVDRISRQCPCIACKDIRRDLSESATAVYGANGRPELVMIETSAEVASQEWADFVMEAHGVARKHGLKACVVPEGADNWVWDFEREEWRMGYGLRGHSAG